jgi:hypothetical protein
MLVNFPFNFTQFFLLVGHKELAFAPNGNKYQEVANPMDGSQCPPNNKPQWLQGGREQCYQEPFYQNGTRVWGQSVPQQVPLGYQYIYGGLNGDCNVDPQTSWVMNSVYN